MIINECFECATTEDLQQHHVVPRSRGGTKTITLCTQCHAKAHGKDMKGLNHSRLTKEGIDRARRRGVKLGNPKPREAAKASASSRIAKANKTAIKCGSKIHELRACGKSYREIGELLNLTTKKSTRMNSQGVQNIHKRWLDIRNNT